MVGWSWRRAGIELGASMIVGVIVLGLPGVASGIPSFARKYETSCVTCHYAFPKLNSFGRAFRNNGFRFPDGQDATVTKDTPVRLGAESYKRVWPEGIWPADIAGSVPLSFAASGDILYLGDRGAWTFQIPEELELLFGGTIGEDLSYLGEMELEGESEVEFNFILQYDFAPSAHIRMGTVGLDDTPSPPTQQNRRLTRTSYNVSTLTTASGTWQMKDGAGGGVEFWGAADGPGGRGGVTYSVAIGNGQSDDDNLDLNREKDVFARATYKFGGMGETGDVTEETESAASAYRETSVRVGVFGQAGVSVDDDGREDDFDLAGADTEVRLGKVIFGAAAMAMRSDYLGVRRRSGAAFAEALYPIYPWLIPYARYEYTDSGPAMRSGTIEHTAVPAIVALLRANVRLTLEGRLPVEQDTPRDGDAILRFEYGF